MSPEEMKELATIIVKAVKEESLQPVCHVFDENQINAVRNMAATKKWIVTATAAIFIGVTIWAVKDVISWIITHVKWG